MSNNKQSSVEWLDRWFRDNSEATHKEGDAALKQAKAMHKKEIMDAYDKGEFNDGMNETAEQYYTETYDN